MCYFKIWIQMFVKKRQIWVQLRIVLILAARIYRFNIFNKSFDWSQSLVWFAVVVSSNSKTYKKIMKPEKNGFFNIKWCYCMLLCYCSRHSFFCCFRKHILLKWQEYKWKILDIKRQTVVFTINKTPKTRCKFKCTLSEFRAIAEQNYYYGILVQFMRRCSAFSI